MESLLKRLKLLEEKGRNFKPGSGRSPCEFELMLESQPNPGQNTLITLL